MVNTIRSIASQSNSVEVSSLNSLKPLRNRVSPHAYYAYRRVSAETTMQPALAQKGEQGGAIYIKMKCRHMTSKFSSTQPFICIAACPAIAMPLTEYAPVVVDEASRIAATIWAFPWVIDTVRGWALLIMAVRGL